jgi:hypothetical protein
MESATCGTDLSNSFAIAVSDSTTRKKSNASSVHPRNPATVAYAASRVDVGGKCPPGGPATGTAAAESMRRNIAAGGARREVTGRAAGVRGQRSEVRQESTQGMGATTLPRPVLRERAGVRVISTTKCASRPSAMALGVNFFVTPASPPANARPAGSGRPGGPRGSSRRSSATGTSTASSSSPARIAPLPEDVHAALLARPRAERQRDEPERFPEPVRRDVLRAPAAEQPAPVRRPLELRPHQRRPDQPRCRPARRSSGR